MTPSFLWHAPARDSLIMGEKTPEECRLMNFILEIENAQTIVGTGYSEIEAFSISRMKFMSRHSSGVFSPLSKLFLAGACHRNDGVMLTE